MKRFFTLLAIFIATLSQSFAQSYVNYNRDTRWFIGLNAGGTWTTDTEVDFRLRGGYGFTFGKSFGMEQDKLFSWDFRARFLHAQYMGQSTTRYMLDSTSTVGLSQYGPAIQTYQDSLGYFIPNYRTNLLSGSVELVLNTNRLRQRTGWNLSVFGGIGIKGYQTATDLVDNSVFLNEGIYDYDQVTTTTQSNILNIQDEDYETNLSGNGTDSYDVDWAPSFGFGISKQIHPAVALGLEHKMTWTRNNFFDGMPNNVSTGNVTELNDIYHYTALTLKFHLFNGRYEEPIDDDEDEVDVDVFDDDDPVTDPVTDPVSRKKPIVDIYDPGTSPYETKNRNYRIKANIYYVGNRSGVTFKQDGNINTNFTFNPSTNQFSSNVVLHPGQNLFEITGVNNAGSDYESVIIVYVEEEEPLNPPIVTITNPPYTPYETNSNIFGLVSTVLNVDSKAQIDLYLNGVNLNSFAYNTGTKVLNASLNLNEGTNTVTVSATNAAGSDSKTVQIIYRKPITEQPPIVDFVNPGVDPYYTNVGTIAIKATALNVATKSDLDILVNGNPIGSFSFNVVSKEIYFNTGLMEGANIIEITGVNNVGSDYESTTIIYTKPETPRPPIVTFQDPNVDPLTVYTSSYNVQAKVEYVASAADITLKINGVPSTYFTYNEASDLMNFTTALVEGANVIEIKGVNAYGSDIESTTIIYKKPATKTPPIVDITYPGVDNMVFESPEILLTASVLNVTSASNIDVVVNGVTTTDFSYNIYTKVLQLPLVLSEGTNVVQITGTNLAGTDADTRLIIYEKPEIPTPPTVEFVNPPSTPYLSEVADFVVTAHTSHISSKSQIVLKQNGELIPDVSYSFVAGNEIIYNATLIPGSNIFEVYVENEYGSATDLAVINYELDDEPCVIPTVGYISPVPYSTVEDPNVTIDAQINNHIPGTTVELKLNGVSKGYMTYNAETSIASKAATLLEGSNAVTVIVTNECGTNRATFTLNYDAPDAPCYDPTLSAVGSTAIVTEATSINLSAIATHVSEAGELQVKLNGTAIPFTFDAGTGNISINDVTPLVGSNVVSIIATTECGSAILVYNITREVCEDPLIAEMSPISGTITEDESVVFTATVNHTNVEGITLLVNGVSTAFDFNAETGLISEAISLNVGVNVVQVLAENGCGETNASVNITREIPCASIVTNLLSPAVSDVTATEDVYSISLNATGIDSPEQINATLNGAAVSAGFDPVTGNISLADLSLNEGENVVVVNLTNDCSESTITYNIHYEGCEIPVVMINGVVPGMVVTEDVFNLYVVVTNVTDASDIVVQLNGAPIDFDFDPLTHLVTAEFIINDGSNDILVTANGCETVTEGAEVTYEEPCEPVTHSLITPNTTPTVSLVSEFEITLSVANIENAEQITVTLNEAAVPFTFNPESNIITIADLGLIDGTNNVVVSLENDCSSDVVSYAIIYDGCEPPMITLGENPTAVETALYNFEANVSNVEVPASIQVLLNGAPVPFVFDPVTGGLSAEMNLTEGASTIQVIANGCETSETSLSVVYTIPCEEITYALNSPAGLSLEVAASTININLVVQHVNAEGINVTNAGADIPFTYVDNMLSINGIALVDGANEIVVNLNNACSAETITYTITHDDCNTPSINLEGNALEVESPTYSFVGVVEYVENAEQLTLYHNGTEKPFEFVAGTVSASLALSEGENTIQLNAETCATASDLINVVYENPCSAVEYSLVSPASAISDAADSVITINLNISNADAPTIVTTLNGVEVPHSFSGGVVTIPSLSLIDGANIVSVEFGNACSVENVTYTINYEECFIPIVTINGLVDGMEIIEDEIVFYAHITNTTDAGDITFTFNGEAVPFTFDPLSQMLQASLELHDGTNEMEIIVDGCVMVTDGVEIIHEAPCYAPTYSLVFPAESDVTVEGDRGATYDISLNVNHVTADQISVQINGFDAEFTLSGSTVLIGVEYISVPVNSILVTLENECGTVTTNYTVTFTAPEEEEEACMSHVSADFADDHSSVTANSDKDLSNVVLKFDDETTQKFEGLSGYTGTFAGTGSNAGKCIVGVWIKSGCNLSGDGPGYGAYVTNENWRGTCAIRGVAKCDPITYRLLTPSRVTANTVVSPYSITLLTTNIEDASGIITLVNGKPISVKFDGKKITIPNITLKQGANTIQVTMSNSCSTEKVTYTITYNKPGGGVINTDGVGSDKDPGLGVKAAPVITPMSPMDTRSTVKTQTLSFKAKVLNVSNKNEITLTLNGNPINGFTYSSSTKQLSAVMRLNAGTNLIRVTANNGKSTTLTYYITYDNKTQGRVEINNGQGGNDQQNGGGVQQTTLTPALQTISPRQTVSTTQTGTMSIKLRALNVVSKGGLTLTVNGSRTNNFSFSSSTKIMTAVVRLREGKNTIRIDAVNGGKKASLTYTVTYKKPVQNNQGNNGRVDNGRVDNGNNNGGGGVVQTVAKKPVFQNVSPRSSTETTNKSTYLFKARVQNVSKKSDIDFVLNGKRITAFSFNPVTGEITATLTLKTGTNSIKITARNGNQSASKSYSIKYSKPVQNQTIQGGGKNNNGGVQQGVGGVRRGG